MSIRFLKKTMDGEFSGKIIPMLNTLKVNRVDIFKKLSNAERINVNQDIEANLEG